MRSHRPRLHLDAGALVSATALIVLVLLSCGAAAAPNRTPGDGSGGDHTAYVFAPARFQADRGEEEYRKHVSSDPNSGQQYSYIFYIEGTTPNPSPSTGTLSTFYDIIHNKTDSAGVLLITSHGLQTDLAVEFYAATAAGESARNARFVQYVNGTTGIPGLPAFSSGTDIWTGVDEYGNYVIGVTERFIRAYGLLTETLVYVGSCYGATLTDAFWWADARIAVGNTEAVTAATQKFRVTTFFERMDGKQGVGNRPVGRAMAGLGLASNGTTRTTLAPVVTGVQAPCPIEAGDTITYTFDTECRTSVVPNIVGTSVVIEDEQWVDTTTLKGTCTSPEAEVYSYGLLLPWSDVWSVVNNARLDGNNDPPQSNGEGPAHDDYTMFVDCTASVPEDLVEPRLANPSPNPFRSETFVEYELPSHPGPASLAVYSGAGRLVRTLVDGDVGPGPHSATWDGTDDTGRRLPSGVYFMRLTVGGVRRSGKVVLLE